MDGVTFEFNDIISLYKKNDSERNGQSTYDITKYIWILLLKKIIHIRFKNKKSEQVGVALLYSRLQVSHCIMDGVKFEFNDIISLYEKNDSEQKRSVSLWYY